MQDCSTVATRHPHWEDVREALERRFEHDEWFQKLAIDVVSAHLMGCPARAKESLGTLGPVAAGDVVAICRGYCIDIEA